MPRNRGARTRVATGIYRDATGYAIVAVVDGQHVERRFPADTALELLQRARATLQATLRRPRTPRRRDAAPGTLAGDAGAYLAAVRGMASFTTRAGYVQHWVDALGHVARARLTPADVRTQLQVWATTPRPPLKDGGKERPPYAPETVRHLLKVLRHWYTVLDGKGARNPGREVPLPRVDEPEPRAIPVLILAGFRGILRQFSVRSKTLARLAVIASTGMAHQEVMRLRPEHIRREEGVVLVMARRKGKGARARAVPLTRHSRFALGLMARSNAWGPFSTSSMHTRFRAACVAAGYGHTDWRPYDLRHTILTEIGRMTRDDRAVQAWAGHTSLATTARYTLGSVQARVQQAADGFARVPRIKRGP